MTIRNAFAASIFRSRLSTISARADQLPWLMGILLIVFIFYYPALYHGYVWDDQSLFFESGSLRRGWASIAAITQPVLMTTTYFRPLVMLTFVAEFSLAETSSSLSHAINIAVHLANVALLYLLIRRVLDRLPSFAALHPVNEKRRSTAALVATTGALFYGLHPALVEAAAWVAGRFDLMTTFFMLLALCAATMKRNSISAVIAGGATLLALFCKEMAITLPVLVFLLRFSLQPDTATRLKDTIRDNAVLLASTLVGVAIYLLARWSLMPGFIHAQSISGTADGLYPRLVLIGKSMLFYLHQIVYPYDQLEPSHAFLQSQLGDLTPFNVAAILVLISVLVFCMATLIRARVIGPTAILVVATFVSLTPVLNIVPLTIGGNIGENRFLTFPLVLVTLSASVGWCRIPSFEVLTRRDGARAVQTAVALLVSVLLVAHVLFLRPAVSIWQSDLSLFTFTFKKNPQDANAGLLYLSALNNHAVVTPNAASQLESALERFMEIKSVEKAFPQAAVPIVVSILNNLGKRTEARWYADKAEIMPNPDVRMLLFLARAEMQQTDGHAEAAASSVRLAQGTWETVQRTTSGAERRGTFYFYVTARQAMLERDAGKLQQALDELRRQTSPQRFAQDADRLRSFRNILCAGGVARITQSGTDDCLVPIIQ